jgi:hypothetical protein
VALARAEIDAEVIHEAARGAEILWEDDGSAQSSAGSYSVIQSIDEVPRPAADTDA